MISPEEFTEAIDSVGIRFITGVPDSLLKDVCACITTKYSSDEHIIATNEGSAVALAMGHYLATGIPGLVYMQNSGIGNAINPLVSLASQDVYGVPMLLMIGWRGEILDDGSQIKDEPQHVMQGRITAELLELLEIPYIVLNGQEDIEQLVESGIKKALEISGPFAILVRKGAFSKFKSVDGQKQSTLLSREEVINLIVDHIPGESPIVSTTGKTSRELFELRKEHGTGHEKDFLTVGGMGHASQIAAGIALSLPDKTVYCIDGDGALLMHMGALAVSSDRSNLKHVVINNEAHDSVGGQPTKASEIDITKIAASCGYKYVESATSEEDIRKALERIVAAKESAFLEIKCAVGARDNLGRPDRTPQENKKGFMNFINS
ncbi:MAG: phosphonopyruvate decarboxylase [Balneolaceae bacterium]|nr:phosphonopyruvate decarboxylase [Balneolaceae bacterium]